MRYTLFGRTGPRVSEPAPGAMTIGGGGGRGADIEDRRRLFRRPVPGGR
ncbi:hypothetical protein [Streptomyces radiopugnans]